MKKKKTAPTGAPEWVLTYGDMMSLLLCFFVILAALSEIKSEDRYKEVIRSFQEAFGYIGGVGQVPTDDLPQTSLLNKLLEAAREYEPNQIGDSEDEGVQGRVFRVTQVREGAEIVMGGRITFEADSAELKEEAAAAVRVVADKLRGHNTKIDIRGHSTNEPLPARGRFRDHVDLSYERARAVAEVLVAEGVNRNRIRIVAAGATEPLLRQAYDARRQAENRRVEIVVRESLVSEYEGEGIDFEEQTSDGESDE